MLRIGIAGLGVISGIHLEAIGRLSEQAAVTAVCDIDPGKREKVPGAAFYTDLETMLKEEELDCIHICLPHHLHVPAAKLAARYGINVFLEKPAGLNTPDVEKLLADSSTEPVKIGVCLQNRYNNTTRKLLEILENSTYGALKGCKAIVTWDRTKDYYTKDPWRGKLAESGGGVMLSQAIHTMDLLELFCGTPVWVKGMAGNMLLEEIEVEDTACAHMAFENGASAVFYGTVTHCSNSSIELEIVTENAVFYIKNNRLILLENHRETVLAEDSILPGGKDYYGYSHYNAIREFYLELEGRGGSHVSLQEAVKVNVLIDKIMESAKSGRKVYFNE